MLDLLLVPRTGEVVLEPGKDPEARKDPAGTYRSRFSHADERGEPGFYSVKTEASGGAKILTELTATERTGLARFTFPAGEPAHLLMDWQHAVRRGSRGSESADVSVVSDTAVQGGRQINRWAPHRAIYFYSELSPKPTKVEVFSDNKPVAGHARAARI